VPGKLTDESVAGWQGLEEVDRDPFQDLGKQSVAAAVHNLRYCRRHVRRK
jgi:hypothetical protein